MTTVNYGNDGVSRNSKPHFSVPSLLAIGCALGSFFVGAGAAMLLCILAIVFGAIGLVISLLPGVRGGIISIVSIVLALIGVVVALIRILTPGPSTPANAYPVTALPAIVLPA